MNNSIRRVALGGALAVGILARLGLATGPYNHDMRSWMTAADIFRNGQNIYLAFAWTYTPISFYLFGILGRASDFVGSGSFPFLVRFFLTLVDVSTLAVIAVLARHYRVSGVKTIALFFLNPVSIIITGFHGQFENIAVFFLLWALAVWMRKKSGVIKIFIVWMLLTFGLLVKHILVFPTLWLFMVMVKPWWKRMFLAGASAAVFMISLLPYLVAAPLPIVTQILGYGGGILGVYGVSYLIQAVCGQCYQVGFNIWQLSQRIFLLAYALFVLLFRAQDIARGLLLVILFFIAFTTGASAQYLVLPIALGSLFPSRWYYLYSLIVTLFLLGNWDEFNIAPFQVINWTTVWLFTLLWFFGELFSITRPNPKHGKGEA